VRKTASIGLALLLLLTVRLGLAQSPPPQAAPAQPGPQVAPPVEDFKPAPSNQPGK